MCAVDELSGERRIRVFRRVQLFFRIFLVEKQRRGGFAWTQALPPAPLPLLLPPAAAGVVMAASALLPDLLRRLGLPLLCAASFIPAHFRWTRFTLVALNGVPLVVAVHLPFIPLLRRRSGPFHSLTGLCLPLVPLLLRRGPFHLPVGLRLPRSIALRTPLNLCGCLPCAFRASPYFARRFPVRLACTGGAHNAAAPELARPGGCGNFRPSAVFTRPL